MFLPKVRNKTRMFAPISFIQCTAGIYRHCDKARKRNKRHTVWKRRNKTVFADNVVYVENSRDQQTIFQN